MRIAHVVTHVSHDGAFGGPTRVALAQAKALVSQGHSVTVYAGTPTGEEGETVEGGVTVKTFPVRRVAPFGGFATLYPRGLRAALKRDADGFDVAHIHLARDLVTLPAALAFKSKNVPYVVQPHGMVDPSSRLLARVLDAVATRRAIAGAASALILTDREADDLAEIASPQRSLRIDNGVEVGEIPPYEGRSDTVLFLARLHARKRPVAFVEMARLLSDRLPDTTFILAGPDEGEGPAVDDAIARAGLGPRLRWIGSVPPSKTAELLADARVYVLPSIDEVFPMAILESFSAGTPVVTTDSLGIAERCDHYGAAVITDGSPLALAAAVESVYRDRGLATLLRDGAIHYVHSELDIDAVARKLLNEYTNVSARS